jgi:hypothetical protein
MKPASPPWIHLGVLKKKINLIFLENKKVSWALWKGALAIGARIYAAAMAIVASTFDSYHPNYVLLGISCMRI